jgi:DNA-binding GntR family transcriptional regulator
MTISDDAETWPDGARNRAAATDEAIRGSGIALSKANVSMGKTKEVQVAEFIREWIISGMFKRGQKLKQAELAQLLNVSITPVREALKLLEAEGYVSSSSHKGMVVAPFQLSAVSELLDLRLMLECALTEAAALNLSQDDLDDLSGLNEKVRLNERSSDRDINYRFHFTIYNAANLPQTLHFVRILWAKFPFDLLTAIPSRVNRVSTEHEHILAALVEKDPRKAVKAMRDHIESGWREFHRAYPLVND